MFKNNFLKSPIYLILTMILMLLLALFFADYGKIDVLMPPDDADIFDIIIDENNCEEGEQCDTPVFNEADAPVDPSINNNDNNNLSVSDNEGNFNDQESLNIFSNPAFEMKTIIAPGSSNGYHFVIRNDNNFNVQYSIKMKEANQYAINIKYRLKQDGKYVIGNDDTWVVADELILEKIKLSSKSKMPYILEWKWFDTDHDTEIGKIDNANYKLSIIVMANSI